MATTNGNGETPESTSRPRVLVPEKVSADGLALLEGFDIDNKTGLSAEELMNIIPSYDALIDLEPNRRPFVLTRSATAGTMRYACSSWSGDNVTSWESMKGANALSLNAGMSLLQVSLS